MLYNQDPSDTETVKNWLVRVLEEGKSRGKTAAGLAEHCATSPQAVSGWKKTGRITKTNLAKAAAYFGEGPSFSGAPPLTAKEEASDWPFPGISRTRFQALSTEQRLEIQGVVRDRIERFEEGRAQPMQSEAPNAEAERIALNLQAVPLDRLRQIGVGIDYLLEYGAWPSVTPLPTPTYVRVPTGAPTTSRGTPDHQPRKRAPSEPPTVKRSAKRKAETAGSGDLRLQPKGTKGRDRPGG
ncbi:hypothetical protein [Ideonella paludis]|uniref:Immunity repressor n=2 Tax=Ideonella paludis TaxID=1233411 RepID=A0ABS5DU19_9BURK|nr:hypothetical protein [Ideonella paludis]MBQ0934631.1 hypothetical protein [Ideonella paludis]